MDCKCQQAQSEHAIEKLKAMQTELAEVAKKILSAASDPFTGVIKFLSERPENSPVPGPVVVGVLDDIFPKGDCPALLRIMAGHVKEVLRKGKSVELIKVHPATEPVDDIVVKQADRVKFDVSYDKGLMVLSNVQGLIGIEHGIELPIEKIVVSPPNLQVTVKLGLLRPQKTVKI